MVLSGVIKSVFMGPNPAFFDITRRFRRLQFDISITDIPTLSKEYCFSSPGHPIPCIVRLFLSVWYTSVVLGNYNELRLVIINQGAFST